MKEQIKKKYEIAALLDNKAVMGEMEYDQSALVPIYHPADVRVPQKYPILIMTRHFIDVCAQLLQLGIDENRILFGVSLFPQNSVEQIAFYDGNGLKLEDKKIVLYINDQRKNVISSMEEYEKAVVECAREKGRKQNHMIEKIADMPTVPASRLFGTERGKPIDRYYIEMFLDNHKKWIRGDSLEIAETTYSVKYGEDRLKNAYMLHVDGWGENALKGNLETGEGIEENRFDTVIITQTLMFIYDIQSAARNTYRMLKPGGTALITVAGISQISRYDADNWGSYYSFHEDAVRRLFEPLFTKEKTEILSYGNVKTAVSLLYGLCCEDLKVSDFQTNDPDYPVIIGAFLQK
ncbi:MAG: class I SAM-dependent methyltransferase [Ruminococcus sp.]|nr:class I SAM-dependent methyltransferase [Ruminococcus sp.]